MYHLVQKDAALLDILGSLYPDRSQFSLYSWIKQERVSVDDEIALQADTWVAAEQVVTVQPRVKASTSPLKVIYQDHHLVVVDKPANLPAFRHENPLKSTLQCALEGRYPTQSIYPVHELGQQTSGIMVFALNRTSRLELLEQFETQNLEYNYTAIVEGRIKERSGSWPSWTEQLEENAPVTYYGTIGSSRHFSWLNLSLQHHCKQEIRAHCGRAGYPIVGDQAFGARTDPINRLCLHAHRLAFTHPIHDTPLVFEASIPPEFYQMITSPIRRQLPVGIA